MSKYLLKYFKKITKTEKVAFNKKNPFLKSNFLNNSF
jgi:hypothetical protein